MKTRKKTILINDRYRKLNGSIVEGGFSRIIAWENWLKKEIDSLSEVRLKKGKIVHIFQVYFSLLFNRNSTILFLYPMVGIPIFYKNIIEKCVTHLFFALLKLSARKKEIVFDISDLKYEQGIDLEIIKKEDENIFQETEKKLFSLDIKWIFASESMRSYACKKYGIKTEKTDVCINGGKIINRDFDFSFILQKDTINYVYAGTLNQGRQIENMIETFPDDGKYHLFLLGPGGEWIENKKGNITYLGAWHEEKAHSFVEKCDVGLIPYDENRLYYNIAYPTKLSFYITAGIPYVSTPVVEVKTVNNIVNGGWIAPVSDWHEIIQKNTIKEILNKKKNVMKKATDFFWDNILRKNHFISCDKEFGKL